VGSWPQQSAIHDAESGGLAARPWQPTEPRGRWGRAVDGAVDKAVDKHHFLGRTARVLWMNCGWLKNLGISGRTPLCGPRQGRRNALTAGDGYRPGGDLGDAARAGKPAIDVGIWDRQQVSRARRPSNRCAALRPGEAPPSHTWRGLVLYCRTCILLAGTDTRATAAGSRRGPGAAGRGEMSFLAVNTRRFSCPHNLRLATPPETARQPAGTPQPAGRVRPVTARGVGGPAGRSRQCPAARRPGGDCAGPSMATRAAGPVSLVTARDASAGLRPSTPGSRHQGRSRAGQSAAGSRPRGWRHSPRSTSR
jgi:hypothetical protein